MRKKPPAGRREKGHVRVVVLGYSPGEDSHGAAGTPVVGIRLHIC